MLLVARAGRRRRRRGRWWGYVPGLHPALPSIALTNINTGKVSLELYRIAGLALKSLTPFSGIISLIASRTYTVRGILISRAEMVAEMKLFEHVCMIFLDGLPTVNRSCVRHLNR